MANFEPELTKAWKHSHEEDSENEMVFRPASFPFPRSRGRSGYEFLADGKVIVSDPGADDKPGSSTGDWQLTNNDLSITAPGGNLQRYRVNSLAPDKLVLTRA